MRNLRESVLAVLRIECGIELDDKTKHYELGTPERRTFLLPNFL